MGVESEKPKEASLTFNGKFVAASHGIFAYSAFLSALVVGCWLHYEKIVKNSSFGYPDEWFPSVSATIGDRYPERSVFQILIAVTSGPRFLLIFCNYILNPSLWVTFSGIIRTFTCGGWVYITSTDDHDWHDIFMISYIILTIPWTIGITIGSPKNTLLRKGRAATGITFFAMLVPLVYWFIQHKVHVRAGAYSIYAYFEWALILLDIGFDSWSYLEFKNINFSITNNSLSYSVKEPVKEKVTKVVPPEEADFTIFQFLVITVNSFLFWTILTSLFLCVWYFPLWHMGISGYEACVAVFLSPIFLAAPVRSLLNKVPFLTRLLSIIFGLGAYTYVKPEPKLISVSIGTFFSILSFVNEVSVLNVKQTRSYAIAFLIGLLISSVVKFGFYSNNPFWAVMREQNGGHNEIGLGIGALASLFTPKVKQQPAVKPVKGGSMLLSSLGFGGLFFSLFAYLTDTSTLVFWNWSGFPVTGPTPITGAIVNVISVSIGITIAAFNPKWVTGLVFNIIALLGTAVLYLTEDWYGFAGANVLSLYLVAITPSLFINGIGHNPSVHYSLAFFFHIFISLGSVWIVAYAFVPGGFLLRERTDLILFGSFLMVSAGVYNYNTKFKGVDVGRKFISTTVVLLTTLTAITGGLTYLRFQPEGSIRPYKDHELLKSFNAGIWCVHFGLDNDMWSSHDRMRDLIKDAELDIIGLLETDTERLIGGNRDFTQKIAEDLSMYVDYGPGPHKHTWGAALLSKFPIIKSEHFLLPSPVGELAPAIRATLDIYGEFVDIVVFHSGQEEDVEDRRLQSLGVEEIMASSPRPLVLLSYLVTKPLKGNYLTYASEKSRMHDIDSTDWDRWCEYIMFRELKKVSYARISRSTITDTELQVGKFRLLSQDEKENWDEDFLYGNHFVEEREIPEILRMPKKFRGRGIRGHKYHVFKKPRYFALEREEPKDASNEE